MKTNTLKKIFVSKSHSDLANYREEISIKMKNTFKTFINVR